jgi:hypothetical protein
MGRSPSVCAISGITQRISIIQNDSKSLCTCNNKCWKWLKTLCAHTRPTWRTWHVCVWLVLTGTNGLFNHLVFGIGKGIYQANFIEISEVLMAVKMLVFWVVMLFGLVAYRAEDGGSMFFWKVGICLQVHTALQPRRPTLNFIVTAPKIEYDIKYTPTNVIWNIWCDVYLTEQKENNSLASCWKSQHFNMSAKVIDLFMVSFTSLSAAHTI